MQPIAEEWEILADASNPERNSWVKQQTEPRQIELAKELEAFLAMKGPQREKLIGRHSEISAEPDSEQLRQVALAYYEIVSTRSPGERTDLLEKSYDDRIKALRRLSQKNQTSLSEAESAEFRDALLRYADTDDVQQTISDLTEMVEQGLSRNRFLPPEIQERIRQFAGSVEKNPASVFVFAAMASMGEGKGRPASMPAAVMLRKKWREEWLSQITLFMPLDFQERIQKLSLERQSRMLVGIMAESLRSAKQNDPSRYFAEELSNDQIDYLLTLPSDDMMSELRRLMTTNELSATPFEMLLDVRPQGSDRRPPRGRFPGGPPGGPRENGPPRKDGPPARGFGPTR